MIDPDLTAHVQSLDPDAMPLEKQRAVWREYYRQQGERAAGTGWILLIEEDEMSDTPLTGWKKTAYDQREIIKGLEAEVERLRTLIKTIASWTEMGEYQRALEGLITRKLEKNEYPFPYTYKETMNDKHYPWYEDMTAGLTVFSDQESRSLESLLFEYAHGEDGDEDLDEPYEGAGFCVCPACQVLAPIAAELERRYWELKRLIDQTEEEERVPGLGMFKSADVLSGITFEKRGKK